MNQEIKKKWVEALRSGQYVQGFGQLKVANQFCCLGVLCDLHAKETGGEWDGLIQNPVHGIYYGQVAWAPKIVTDWAGLDTPKGDIGHNGERKTFPELNDHLLLSFEQIADIIEAQL